MKTVLITGAPGQLAYYLSKEFLSKDYVVVTTQRYSSSDFEKRFSDWQDVLTNKNLKVEILDISDSASVKIICDKYRPSIIINAAALSHVYESFKTPALVFDINTKPVTYFLEWIKDCSAQTRFINLNTSEMYGSNFSLHNGTKCQDENTPLVGNSHYAVSKIAAHNLCRLYREAYGLFAASAICFNMESPLRSSRFLTRKVTNYIGQLKNFDETNGIVDIDRDKKSVISQTGKTFPMLGLGNLSACRDWQHAVDAARGIRLAVEHSEPDDFVFCSGQTQTVEKFVEAAFELCYLHYNNYIYIDPQFFRPLEVDFLKGSSEKAKKILGWEPEIGFYQIVREMVEADINRQKHGVL